MDPQLPERGAMPRGAALDRALGGRSDTPAERSIASQVLAAGLLLTVTRISLLILGFPKTAGFINGAVRRRQPRSAADGTDPSSLLYPIALAAALLPFRILCLERSLVVYYRLRREGTPATLRMGVRALPFKAHAWVELEGTPIGEEEDHLRDFTSILELGR